MSDKQDRRSQRTRHLLSAALVELIKEKDYNGITVSDIIERANVGRSTFYAHYRDKDDLFVGELDRVIELLSHRIPDQKEMPFFPSLGLFHHVGEEYELYKSLLWGPGIDLLIKHLQKSLTKRIEKGLQESRKEFNVPIPILANFIGGSFLTLLQWWLENKMIYPPEEMNEIFKRLTLAGIEKY
ncbi:MAG TPA: TetR/AcrR family transcriptional regulator [Anaerolineales bacterium]|nr:TetR/AcrR family transcriptional regulator [Anaerolineales bacterium]